MLHLVVMRLPLALAACVTIAASAAEDPASIAATLSSVRINGWYRCSASTLWPNADTNNFHSDEYFLDTADDRKAAASKAAKSRHGGAKQSRHDAKAKPRTLTKAGREGAAFLDDPLEFAQSHARWRAKKAHSENTNGASHGQLVKKKKSGIFGDSSAPRYECAEFRVPYCYEGLCESNRTMDVFVKRVVAQHDASAEDARGKSLWVLQGGPGASSTAMEDLMETMYNELDGAVSIYTMDHRGTARSNRLECQAAEAQTPGSPGGPFVVLEEVPDCIDDILFKIDNLSAAFSVTSAAMDLRTVIDHSLSDEDVYVYGLSYGTYLVERLIHVAPDNVKGFVIDGIVSEAGGSIEERSTYSNWDHDVGVVGARFFGYCEADEFCKSKFRNVTDLTQFVKDLYAELNEAALHRGENSCADALQSSDAKSPSYFLRSAFGDMLTDEDARLVIPALVYRAARCSDEDVEALQYFVDVWTRPDTDKDVDLDDMLFTSQMLYSVIVFSEMWEYPSPSKETLIKWYEDSVMGSDNYATFPYYCLFTGSREDACKALKHLPPSLPMVYERDEYWNLTAKLPPQASALMLSGGLDLQTRRMYGNLQYESLGGDRMLVQFDYAGHCTTFTTPTKSGGPTCGVQILASYVKHDGNVSAVDTSCVGDVYGLDFDASEDLARGYMGVTGLYD